ncbi:HdaA/DnaA family protein [Salinarimonas sp. NSM]|uniref:HdaA/DnaA family protein n=1 Tax=Salinarimonas sp. NSM TaxID=3458003 RepID=UPI004037532A
MAEPGGRMRQLPLDLAGTPSHAEEDFLVGPSNEAAYAAIEAWPRWSDPVLRLEGPPGSGKTHLGAIWAARAGPVRIAARLVREEDVPQLAAAGAILVEDADAGPLDEPALFHLLNRVRERGGSVLITAASPPEAWGITTRDLLSRLRLAPVARLAAPDDGLFKAVLVKLFLDRQLVVDTRVVDYLAVRLERSLAAAGEAVAALDAEALSAKRRITRPMAAAWLRATGRGEGEEGEDEDEHEDG